MDEMVPTKPTSLEKIIIVGNSTEDTAHRAAQLAELYSLPLHRLLTEVENLEVGVYYTDIGTVTLDQFLELARRSTLIIMLDQGPESYHSAAGFRATVLNCRHLSHFKPVIFENCNPTVYVTSYYSPRNTFNIKIYMRVKNDSELLEQLQQTDIRDRDVVLQLQCTRNSAEAANARITEIVDYCRGQRANFIMFRADPHEQRDEDHYQIIEHLISFPEFMLLTPETFHRDNLQANLDTTVADHRRLVYGHKFSYQPGYSIE